MCPAPASARARPSVGPPQDACPGATALHEAADGALARIRIPGGLLTAAQWSALADAAASLGDGGLQLTSRGNVEIRGMSSTAAPLLADLLRDHALLPSESHERVRNIVSSPLSGLDSRSGRDVSVVASQLDDAIQASRSLAALSGRFLFGLDDGRGDVVGLAADLTLTGSHRAALLIAGHRSGITVEWVDGPALLVAAARAFLAERAADERAADERAADERADDGRADDQPFKVWRIADLPDGPERVAARLGGRRGARATAGLPPALGFTGAPDGSVALVATVPFGRFTQRQARLVAAAGAGLRVTPWRSVVLPGLSAARASALARELRGAGFALHNSSPWRFVSACTGAPGCGKALADVRADALAAVESRKPDRKGIAVHWSGCQRRCGHPADGFIDIAATQSGYREQDRR